MKKIAVIALTLLFIVGCESNPDKFPHLQQANGVNIEFIGTVQCTSLYKITIDSVEVLYSTNQSNGNSSMTKIK